MKKEFLFTHNDFAHVGFAFPQTVETDKNGKLQGLYKLYHWKALIQIRIYNNHELNGVWIKFDI